MRKQGNNLIYFVYFELKMHFPSHSSLTIFSIVLQILVSQDKIKSGSFFFKKWKTFLLFGFLPMEFALKLKILNFVAELDPPSLLK